MLSITPMISPILLDGLRTSSMLAAVSSRLAAFASVPAARSWDAAAISSLAVCTWPELSTTVPTMRRSVVCISPIITLWNDSSR